MDAAEREGLRSTFDAVAADYERARPPYPEAIFDDLISITGLALSSRVVEIGCGTGQATVPLARRGLNVTAVELGAELADVARARVSAFPNVAIVNAAFETWDAPNAVFDAATSFAAFHWLDPGVKYDKVAALLQPHGALAVFDWFDALPSGSDASFFAEVVADYDAVVPEWEMRPPRTPSEVTNINRAEIERSGRFGSVTTRRYTWNAVFGPDEYVVFLNTRSSYRLIDDARRARLFALVRARVAAQPSGSVCATFVGLLNVARQLASPS